MSNSGRVILLVLSLLGLVWFVSKISWVIQLIVISLLIVYVLFPITEYLKKKRNVSHFLAVGVTFLCFLFVILILIVLVFPVVQREIQEIAIDLPKYIVQLQRYIEEASDYLMAFDLGPEIVGFVRNIFTYLHPALKELASFSVSVISGFIDIFLIMFMVFYLLYDFKNIRLMLVKILPGRYQAYSEIFIAIIDRNIGNYIRGNVVRCTIVGLLTGIILSIIGMPYSLLLGIVAGLLNIILYIGPYVAAIPALLLSLSPQNPSLLVVIIIYVAVQAVDGFLLTPMLLGRAVRLKPITIIISLLVGQQLAGVLGMIMAVPLAGIIRSLMDYFGYIGEKAN
ncbi:MAG TPA: AI-2E family transporter [Firmicutes bacterium]|jgi:predicted PurR-regulated permease PerM|nr:AI-2E family transporter [Bacillota bacterium]